MRRLARFDAGEIDILIDLAEARVLVAYGGHGVVQAESGDRLDCVFRRKVGRPVCGDQVMLRRADSETGC